MVESWVLLSFAALIFAIGFWGVVVRRELLVILMSLELMLNAVNLTFVIFSHQHQDLTGQASVIFLICLAAAESAVGLGLVIAMFRTLRSSLTSELEFLGE